MGCVRNVVWEEMRELGARDDVLDAIRGYAQAGLPVDPMACVARGASLKAGKIIEPVGKVIAEGYGTIYGPVPGHDDFFAPIIRENSNYPITESGVLTHPNPKALEVPIPLVAKRPDVERSTHAEIVYRYEYLGNYTLGITPTGKMPTVDIVLTITDDKRMIANLVHSQTHQKVRFEGLDHLEGTEIPLQEHTRPQKWTRDEIMKFKQTVKNKKSRWTMTHLEHHIHVAHEAVELVHDASLPRVKKAVREVRDAVDKAVQSGLKYPDDDCPNISNRIKELLDALRQPGVDQIGEEEFREYLVSLTRISEMD
jgi:molecular chaperone DnaK (HSP70)